ncbi:hypothetical protein VP424E501_P0092 [Vibrio phage 424E50-1]|nr:hypothetical protein VP424E501_P0092 [Vibrio phage 424E50-1]
MSNKLKTGENLNLDDNWEPNEDAYKQFKDQIEILEDEVEAVDSIISVLYDDISMWKERKAELLEVKSNLKVEEFI